MKPFPREQMFGMYKGDRVMVIGVPDEIGDGDGLCEIFYDSPLTADYSKTKQVRWGDVEHLEGPAVESR